MKIYSGLFKLVVSALPLPLVACGGQVFLDSDTRDSGAAARSDATTPDPLVPATCGSTPELVVVAPNSSTRIEALVANENNVAFSTSLPDATYALYATRLADRMTKRMTYNIAGRGGTPLVAPPVQGSKIALSKSRLFYTVRQPPGPGVADAVWVTDIGSGSGDGQDAVLLGEVSKIAASGDSLFGLAADRKLLPEKFGAWLANVESPMGPSPRSFEHQGGELIDISGFDGGFAALEKGGKRVFLGLVTRSGTLVDEELGACFQADKVRAWRSPNGSISVFRQERNRCITTPETRVVRGACVSDLDGNKTCPEAADTVLLNKGSGYEITDLQARADGSLVVAMTNNSGLRPAAQLVWVRDGIEEVIGGEGASGTVDQISAVATSGNCVYWAEQGSAGTRIMRVGR